MRIIHQRGKVDARERERVQTWYRPVLRGMGLLKFWREENV